MRKMMTSLRKLLMSKKMRYGTNATILTVVFVAILIVINLIVGTLVQKFTLKMDLTKNKMFEFSQQTLDVLQQLNQPVNIYALYQQGQEDIVIKEILNRYAAKSNQIKIDFVDPVKNPTFANKYNKDGSSISTGSIIFESGDKFKVIKSYDLVDYSYQTQSASSLKAEQQFTSALIYLTSDKIPTVYMTQGHGESDLYGAKTLLEKENYKVENISLVTTDIPEDAGLIVVSSPQRDFGSEEIEKLDAYFDKGGSAMFLFDPGNVDLPKLEAYIKEWGMELQKDIIIEGDQNHFLQYRTYLLPDIQSHGITSRFVSNKVFMLIPGARSIDILFEEQSGVKVSSLLKSTDKSWGKVNLETQTIEKQPEDSEGPLNIAVVATKPVKEGEKEAKLFVAGSSQFLDNSFLNAPNFANSDFFMNTVNWLQNKEESITIRPKSLTTERLAISQSQALIYSAIVVIVIPLLVFVMGTVVWLRRKHL